MESQQLFANQSFFEYGLNESIKSQLAEAGALRRKNYDISGNEQLKLRGPAAKPKAQLRIVIAAAAPVVLDITDADDRQKIAAMISGTCPYFT